MLLLELNDNMLWIMCFLIILLYVKWLFFALLFILHVLSIRHKIHKTNFLFKILATPCYLLEKCLRFGGERFLIYNIGLIPSHHIRKWMYIGLGAHIEKKVVMHYQTEIREPSKLYIGKGSIIGDDAILDARCGLTIGRNVNLSSDVHIYTLQHDHRSPDFSNLTEKERKMSVEIGNRVWLGSNVEVLPGVCIGEGAVCCAGCVVTKDVDPFAIVAGIPAKKIGERNKFLTYEFTGKSCRLY